MTLGRGGSLRLKVFCAMAAATLVGALATGLYATLLDAGTLGFFGRLLQVAPKAFALAMVLLPLAAVAAALVARVLTRSVEELSDVAARMAEGERAGQVPAGHGIETQKLSRALLTLQRELADKPYAAASLRDAWHDLKTPLTAIRATLEVLEDGALEDPVAAPRFLTNMARSIAELEDQLEQLVTLARFETAALDVRELASLEDLVAVAVRAVEPLARARHVSLSTSTVPTRRLRCDESALTRALGNLLENAIEASPGGFVRVDVDDRARRHVTMDVTNGPSRVPMELRTRLFERCATSGKSRGSGLGLAIVRAAVEAHGGKVRFVALGPPEVAVRIELPR